MIVSICIFIVLFANTYSLAKRIEVLEKREKARASKESFYNIEGRVRGLEEQARSK